MINEKEGDTEILSQVYDARIVQTVRNLKKDPSRSDDNKSSGDSDNSISRNNQPEKESSRRSSEEPGVISGKIQNIFTQKLDKLEKSNKKESDIEKSRETVIKSINSNNNQKKFSTNKEIGIKMRISIDGSETNNENKPNFTSNIPGSKPTRNHASENLTKFKVNKETALRKGSTSFKLPQGGFAPTRTKSEFQKRLMSENNINKYKTLCVAFLKDDEELKKMCEYCSVIPANQTGMFSNNTAILERFMEEFFFSDNYFLYKLESLLSQDVSKQKKENFFKDEIKKFFEIRVLDVQYESKLKALNNTIEKHINYIQNFEFFA